jgi:chloride channel 3/4/5
MWLGKEGPFVHVACCCANLFIKLFHNINGNEARKREVLSAAAASGISVAFGSPVGGVLFCLEQISYYFPDKTMWQSFVCAMTAAVMLQAFDPFRTGQLVLYESKFGTDWKDFEIVPYAILGVIGVSSFFSDIPLEPSADRLQGIYGGLFIKTNMAVARWKKNTPWLPHPITQVVIIALLTALINYPNFYMKLQASELVSNLFVECKQAVEDPIGLCKQGAASSTTIVLLLFGAVLGFFLAAVTFGLQLPAGIILPSMAIGALTGRAVGIMMEMWVIAHPGFFPFASCEPEKPCVIPATYAVVGAAATLAGATRMTVSIVVIMFELTGALTYVLPMMVAVMISKWVGDAFSRRGIYESWIHFNEYPFLDHSDTETAIVPDASASQIMTRIEDLVVLTATGHTIASLTAILEQNPHRGFPVISDPREAILLGYISRAELAYNLRSSTQPPRSLPPETETFFSHQPLADPRSTLDLRPWMDQTPITMPSQATLHLVVTYFQKLGLRYVLFADRGTLVGLLTKKDVWQLLNGAAETRRTAGGNTARAAGEGIGVVAGDGGDGEEAQGLLSGDGPGGPLSPAVDRGPML